MATSVRSQHRVVDREGVTIAYHDRGAGAQPLFSIHGVACQSSQFAQQIDHFLVQHRVIAVDLPGHGASAKPAHNYTTAGYADDLAWLIREIGLYRPVVVGHSLGGNIALALAASAPDLVAAIILLDSPTLVPAEALPIVAPLFETLGTEAFRPAFRDFTLLTLGPAAPSAIRDVVLADAEETPTQVIEALMRDLPAFDAVAAVSACRVPVLYVDFGSPNSDLNRFRSLCPQLQVERVKGAGHWAMLESPDRVNAIIEQFLSVAR